MEFVAIDYADSVLWRWQTFSTMLCSQCVHHVCVYGSDMRRVLTARCRAPDRPRQHNRFHVVQITCMSIFMSIWTSVLFMFPSHTHIHTYTHTYIHTYIHTYTHTHTHTRTHARTHTHPHTPTHTHTHTHKHTHTQTHTHTHPRARVHTCTRTRIPRSVAERESQYKT